LEQTREKGEEAAGPGLGRRARKPPDPAWGEGKPARTDE